MEKYIPDMYKLNIYNVNYNLLKEHGIKCILFDLDNTIVPLGNLNPSDEFKELLKKLQLDFEVIIFTNTGRCRAEKATSYINIEYVHSAHKPNPKKLIKLLNEKKYNENEVAIIGDQMMTDVLVGNRAGITTVLVTPFSKLEAPGTKINRIREYFIMKKCSNHNLFFKGRYYE